MAWKMKIKIIKVWDWVDLDVSVAQAYCPWGEVIWWLGRMCKWIWMRIWVLSSRGWTCMCLLYLG